MVTNSCLIPLLFVIGRDTNGRILEKAPHHSVPVPDLVPAACHMTDACSAPGIQVQPYRQYKAEPQAANRWQELVITRPTLAMAD